MFASMNGRVLMILLSCHILFLVAVNAYSGNGGGSAGRSLSSRPGASPQKPLLTRGGGEYGYEAEGWEEEDFDADSDFYEDDGRDGEEEYYQKAAHRDDRRKNRKGGGRRGGGGGQRQRDIGLGDKKEAARKQQKKQQQRQRARPRKSGGGYDDSGDGGFGGGGGSGSYRSGRGHQDQNQKASRRQSTRRAGSPSPKPGNKGRGSGGMDYGYDPRRSRGGHPSRRGGPAYGKSGARGRGRAGSSRSANQIGPYVGKAAAGAQATFFKGVAVIKSSIPEIRERAEEAVATAQNIGGKYAREVKGMMSSELEQVLLKATRPDETAVKPKHVERLVGVTYQISGQYDLYDPILRKLWAKMAEPDYRTNIKALYVLHRFASDGSPDHASALKARLRELRRTRDQKRKDKYFNSRQLLATAATDGPELVPYKAFLARYAHYVLLRTQCFGGSFTEISPSSSARSSRDSKPITSTSLRPEHLEAAKMVLKSGSQCTFRKGEDCDNTSVCVERVATDLSSLTSAVATALTKALKPGKSSASSAALDAALLRKWCEFYSEELLPQTKAMLKASAPKLDEYGLYLSTRLGPVLPAPLLQKGLGEKKEEEKKEEEEEATDAAATQGAAGRDGGIEKSATERSQTDGEGDGEVEETAGGAAGEESAEEKGGEEEEEEDEEEERGSDEVQDEEEKEEEVAEEDDEPADDGDEGEEEEEDDGAYFYDDDDAY